MPDSSSPNDFPALFYSRTPLGIASDIEGPLLNLDRLSEGARQKVMDILEQESQHAATGRPGGCTPDEGGKA